VLANGKKVAPQALENRLLESPFISQVVIVGEQQHTVAHSSCPPSSGSGQWAQEQGLAMTTDEKIAVHLKCTV